MYLQTHGPAGGAPVLMLHSSGQSGAQWYPLATRLPADRSAWMPDFLGAGRSPPWPEGVAFDWRNDVEAVAALVDRAPGPVDLIGHSYGGLIAVAVAAARPTRVRTLAVYEPVAFGVLYAPPDVDGLADLSRAATDPAFAPANPDLEAWLQAFIDYWNGPGTWQALRPGARAALLREGRISRFEVDSLMGDRTPVSTWANIPCPTLLLTGERSPMAARRVVRRLAAGLPQARLRVIPGAGHLGPMTHANEVFPLLLEHLNGA